jgi:hypothetical protein
VRKPFRTALLALLLTAACAGPPSQSTAEPTAVSVVASVAAPTTAPATLPATTEASAEGAATAVVEPTSAAENTAAPTETRAPRLNLEATDPSTVSLAAGKPQLVEFFAFW